jgi:type IV pilus assembly protein PilC
MVKIGEQTGKLDESLLKVSEYFEREVDGTVKTLTTAMEPFIMIVLGVGVSFLIISIITPIYNLTSSIQ